MASVKLLFLKNHSTLMLYSKCKVSTNTSLPQKGGEIFEEKNWVLSSCATFFKASIPKLHCLMLLFIFAQGLRKIWNVTL